MHHPDELYALWLQQACGIASTVYLKLFTRFSSCREIYDCTDYSFLDGKHRCEKQLRDKDLSTAYELQKRLHASEIHVLTYYDDRYPDSLRLIQAPPAVLYAIGDLRDLNKITGVAIVGTRKMTPYGASVAEDFAKRLTLAGAVVISGLAKGIDTCAHRGAFRAQGYTVAVLGTPIDEIYPKENAKAFHAMYKSGLVISEMYPGCKRTKGDFPNRNRIISGLSKAVLVVEAGETSGALITARHAVYQNKPVFAVPGTLGDVHAGTNALLKNGARFATSPADILAELAMEHPTEIHPENLHLSKQVYARGNVIHTTDEDEPFPEIHELPVAPEPTIPTVCKECPPPEEGSLAERICGFLKNRAMSADELSLQLGVGISDLLGELTELEIEGKVQSLAGNRFTCI